MPSPFARAHRRSERVELAACLARVARHFGHAPLVAVELLQRDHRQVDVVLLEAKQRHRVVHEHVGVEHEQLGRSVAARLVQARLGGGTPDVVVDRGGFEGERRRGGDFGAAVVQREFSRRRRLGGKAGLLGAFARFGRGLRFEVGRGSAVMHVSQAAWAVA
jgi:hypothetical protein